MDIKTLIDASFNPMKKINLMEEKERNANEITDLICSELGIQDRRYSGTECGLEASVKFSEPYVLDET